MNCRYCRNKEKGYRNQQQDQLWFCKRMPGSPSAVNGSIYTGLPPDNCPIVRDKKYRPRLKGEILTPPGFKFKKKGIKIKPGVYIDEVDISIRVIPSYVNQCEFKGVGTN